MRLLSRSFFQAAAVCILVGTPDLALAWQWNAEPQPLLQGREPIRADAGSPLAWDDSARRLWFVYNWRLNYARWTGAGFQKTATALEVRAGAGMVVDPGRHLLFYSDPQGLPRCARWLDSTWQSEKLSDQPVSRWLAVDARRHLAFGFDPAAHAIRSFFFDAQTGEWRSSIIATGLGNAEDGGVFDTARRILYTTHADADVSLPRHPLATAIGDPTGAGFFRPWPLVATSWNGTAWISEVLDETGLAQQPALLATDHRVFYAKRDALRGTAFFLPAGSIRPASTGSLTGWSGTDRFEDHDQYTIRKPQYPSSWTSSNGGSWGSSDHAFSNITFNGHYTNGPISIFPWYEPVRQVTPLAPRLVNFRALINPRQNRLVQQRLHHEAEELRTQIGTRLAGYLYRDAKGDFFSSLVSHSGLPGEGNFPPLGADFDPANPPVYFAALSNPNTAYSYTPPPAGACLDPNAPFLPPQLRLPKRVEVRTFGHAYLRTTQNQPGARYRHYQNFGTDLAVPSGIAVDRATEVTFYTQAPPPAASQDLAPPADFSFTSPQAVFAPEPDPKLRPSNSPSWEMPGVFPEHVWIVMVY